ncbi:MAG: FIG001802: Putative alkaline-shock protein [uncultured Thermomicrobiales bacterium]|uniref:FIG001802: Putative alkaline-shock protein n=1 Tax=uncultured Thermomicrobiales bacterium TaxID=1645740 RepID=A0A6J4VUY6_9BACT|nr:MAG: FIG001802: Putative alkaline-shock protein [uncultured Thermomicrobiales bacterium]
MLRRGRVATASGATGKVEISRAAIASIAHGALMESYGVVGMAPSGLRGNLAYYLRQDDPRRGIAVEVSDEQITITLSVILEYGVRISEVAQNVMGSVKFAVERALGMKVVAVNVYVQGLHFSDDVKGKG